MAKDVLIALDFHQQEIQNVAIQTLASAPGSPVVGQIYFNSVDLQLYIWDGTAWGLVATDAEKLNGQAASYYLSRANQTGTQTASTISDFDTAVRLNPINLLATATGNINIGGYRITGASDASGASDYVTKGQFDSALQGLTNKHTADYATTAALAANTYSNGTSGVGATLTANANGALTVDTISVAAGDTVLVKDEVDLTHNGLYSVTQEGDGSTPYILTRVSEMDTATEFSGAVIAIRSGSANNGTLWLMTANDPFVVGTDDVEFININSATVLTAGDGIDITANVITVKLASGGGLQFNGSGEVEMIELFSDHKYVANIGNGSAQSFTLTHNFGTRDVTVAVFDNATYKEPIVDITHSTTNTTVIDFGTVPTSNQYRVVILW